MGLIRRLFGRLAQSDEARHQEEVRGWADEMPETTRIEVCPERGTVRIAGVVRRLTLRPLEGEVSLSAVVDDGTGECVALWTGRDHIPGLRLGTRVVLEGVIAPGRGNRQIVNPRYEFA